MRPLSRLLLCACAVGPLAAPVSAQTLLRDLDPFFGSAPAAFTPLHDRVLFTAHSVIWGAEVWSTDGTTPGTQVLDVLLGAGSGLTRPGLTALDDVVLFFGNDGIRRGLFATDGTPAGTHFLATPNVSAAQPVQMSPITVLDGRGYFTAWDGLSTSVLIRTDGTVAGTGSEVAIAGMTGTTITATTESVFFPVWLGGGGALWSSDGTAGGTAAVASWASSSPEQLTPVGARLFFRENSGAMTTPLWVSDGTPAGTFAVPGFPPAWVVGIADLASTAIVLCSRLDGAFELWRSDGTASGTALVAQLRPPTGTFAVGVGDLVAADDAVYVHLGTPASGEFWRTDGTAAGTVSFWPNGYRLRTGSALAPIGDRVLFASSYAGNGEEPWLTDGTTAGTRNFADIAPGAASSDPDEFTIAPALAAGPAVLFAANDGVHGIEPWIVPLKTIGAAALGVARPGCASSAPPPRLVTEGGTAQAGNAAFALSASTAQPNTPIALLVGGSIGTPIGACASLVPAAVTMTRITDPAGSADFALPIPANPSLIGMRVFVQPAVAVPGGAVLGVIDTGSIGALVIGG